MKKELNRIMGLYLGVLTDLRSPVCLSGSDLRSLSQLGKLITSRGCGVVYKDFPALLKVIDKSLTDGFVSLPTLRRTLGSLPGTNLPRLFNDWFANLYDEEGQLLDPDPNHVLAVRQLMGMFKRVRRPASKKIEQGNLNDFHATDRLVPAPIHPVWDESSTYRGRLGQQLVTIMLQNSIDALPACNASARIAYVDTFNRILRLVSHQYVSKLPSVNWEMLAPKCKHGPGAIATGLDDKYWAIQDSIDDDLVGVPGDLYFYNWEDPRAIELVPEGVIPVKVIAVPKTQSSTRIIGVESASRQWAQQGLNAWLRTGIADHLSAWISLEDQGPSQRLAVSGSRSGMLATIDLSSASDRLSCALVEACFPRRDILAMMGDVRARWYTLPPRGDVNTHPFNKFAHMGSAITFPVQTVCYLMVALATFLMLEYHESGSFPTAKRVRRLFRDSEERDGIRVFGDDIIVPSYMFEAVSTNLQMVGMKVNQLKSHGHGFFREACGADAYKGYIVNPTYVSELVGSFDDPEGLVSMVECSNNLHRAGFWHAAEILMRYCGNLCVPISREPGSLSFCTFSGGPGIYTRAPWQRWSQDLQRQEVSVHVAVAKQARVDRLDGHRNLHQFEVEWVPELQRTKSSSTLGFAVESKPRVKIRYAWVSDRSSFRTTAAS